MQCVNWCQSEKLRSSLCKQVKLLKGPSTVSGYVENTKAKEFIRFIYVFLQTL